MSAKTLGYQKSIFDLWLEYLYDLESSLYDVRSILEEFEFVKRELSKDVNKQVFLELISKYMDIRKNSKLISIKQKVRRMNKNDFIAQDRKQMDNYLEESINFYNFLHELYENDLSAYYVQKKRKEILRNLPKNISSIEEIKRFLEKNRIAYKKNVFTKNSTQKIKHFREVIIDALNHEVTNTTNNDTNTLTIQGKFIQTSLLKNYEREVSSAKFVNIFASNTVFFDGDYDLTGKKIQLSIISPKWEVVKTAVKIILNGEDGKEHYNSQASSWNWDGGDGRAGKDGIRGGAAGKFLGISNIIVNSESLEIYANGGVGGPGQKGGDGRNGSDDIIYDTTVDKNECMPRSGFMVKAIGNYTYEVYGKNGTRGGNGGRGGEGGLPGHSGDIQIFQLNTNEPNSRPKIHQEQIKGNQGTPGKGGRGGLLSIKTITYYETSKVGFRLPLGPDNKRDVVQNKENKSIWSKAYWRHEAIKLANKCTFEVVKSLSHYHSGLNGTSVDNSDFPKVMGMLMNPAHTINEYKSFGRYSMETTKSSKSLLEFVLVLEKHQDIQNFYNILSVADDFKMLEQQYRNIKNKKSLDTFYTTIEDRIKANKDNEVFGRDLISLLNKRKSKDFILPLDNLQNLYNVYNIKINNYQIKIERKKAKERLNAIIQKSMDHLNTYVKTPIDESLDKIDEIMENVVVEINKQQRQNEVDKERLDSQRQKLKQLLVLKSVVGALKTTSAAVQSICPPVAIATIGIGLAEGAFLVDKTGPIKVIHLPKSIKKAVNKQSEQKPIHFHFPSQELEQSLRDIVNNGDRFKEIEIFLSTLDQNERPVVMDLISKLIEIKTLGLCKGDTDKNYLNSILFVAQKSIEKLATFQGNLEAIYKFSIKSCAYFSCQFTDNNRNFHLIPADVKTKIMQVSGEHLRKVKSIVSNVEENSDDLVAFVGSITSLSERESKEFNEYLGAIINVGKIAISSLESIGEDIQKINDLSEALGEADENTNALAKYEKKIKSMAVTTKNSLGANLENFYEQLKTAPSTINLINKFQITEAIRLFQEKFSEMTADYIDKSAVNSIFTTISSAVNTMADVYKDIEGYYEKYEQKESTESLKDYNPKKVQYSNPEYTEVLASLELEIASNVIWVKILPQIRTLLPPSKNENYHDIGNNRTITDNIIIHLQNFIDHLKNMDDENEKVTSFTLRSRLNRKKNNMIVSTTINDPRIRKTNPRKLLSSLMEKPTTPVLSDVPQLDYSGLNSNLLLLDVLLRKKQGGKPKVLKTPPVNTENAEYANSLAYSAYAPRNTSN